ncbi:hypothetical protein [Paenibacillus rhizophilus]|uniref:Uncharacterized protein n=1 Tax=Paenibacillus rhizophilus TaxID=1850366 RepID=A0A3N9P2S6_9BACL|nr:hypothetical protein [Paenibacillus rhizophilus]RQW10531.1 hypothetical protein EH198_14775 [Paenibacillus rhizophilus]
MEPVNPSGMEENAESGTAPRNGITDWGGSDGFSLLNSAADAPREKLQSPEAGQETGDASDSGYE